MSKENHESILNLPVTEQQELLRRLALAGWKIRHARKINCSIGNRCAKRLGALMDTDPVLTTSFNVPKMRSTKNFSSDADILNAATCDPVSKVVEPPKLLGGLDPPPHKK